MIVVYVKFGQGNLYTIDMKLSSLNRQNQHFFGITLTLINGLS